MDGIVAEAFLIGLKKEVGSFLNFYSQLFTSGERCSSVTATNGPLCAMPDGLRLLLNETWELFIHGRRSSPRRRAQTEALGLVEMGAGTNSGYVVCIPFDSPDGAVVC